MSRRRQGSPNLKVTQQPDIMQSPHKQIDPPSRNFGLLKTRSLKLKQSEANIFRGKEAEINFSKLDHDRLIQIVNGTDISRMRSLSKYFLQTNGIYARSVRYLSDLYKFDFLIYPNIDLDAEIKDTEKTKILKRFNVVLEHFDNSSIQLLSRKWASQVCIEGAYYGYICEDISDKIVIQDLPTDYCRSRFLHRGLPLIEFNCEYFNKITQDTKYREQLLNLFPEEIKRGYRQFIAGRLPSEYYNDDAGWLMLDSNRAFKFNFNDNDIPPFLYVIPSLIELDEVQDIEKEKLLQELQKILVQRFDLDKNGQIPFTMTELQQLNQNAIDMVGEAVGVSVLSTVASVNLENLAPDNRGEDRVEVAENTAYNNLGISDNLFNTDGNLALEKSIITDEAYVKPLLLQFERFFNNYINWQFNKNNSKFRLKMLTTTIFNYVDLSNSYKDLTKIGFSRFLPMVALGHTQKEVSSMAKLEQQIMQLDNWMLPPFSSNTMSSDTWADVKNIQGQASNNNTISNIPRVLEPTAETGSTGGRPEMDADKKSEKTIQNRESMT